MIAIHIDKVKSIQLSFEEKIKQQRLNAIAKLEKIKPISTDDCNYLYSVKELFKNNPDIITWEPKRLDDEMKKFTTVPLVIIKKNKKGEDIIGKSQIKEKILESLGYKALRKSFYPIYFREIKIKSCIYCNSQLAITSDKSYKNELSAKFDVDHYRSKDEYPFLSICLFNLYPSCSSCNRSKSYNDNIEFELYTEYLIKTKKSDYKFHFSSFSKAKYLTTRDSKYLEFTFKEPSYSADKKKFNDVFHIQGIYETQLDIVEELVIKTQIYNPSYIKIHYCPIKIKIKIFKIINTC